MKRAGFLLAFLIILGLPVFAGEVKPAEDVKLPQIFIWAIPEDEDGAVTTEKQTKKSKKNEETKRTHSGCCTRCWHDERPRERNLEHCNRYHRQAQRQR